MTSVSRRDVLRLGAAGLLSLPLTACGGSSAGQGSLDPNSLRPFEPGRTGGTSTGLPTRVAWASTADSEFFLALGAGMKQAAAERGVDYVTATSGNDPAKHVDQMNAFLRGGIGAMAMQPLSPDADSLVLQRAIDKGVCAQGIITARWRSPRPSMRFLSERSPSSIATAGMPFRSRHRRRHLSFHLPRGRRSPPTPAANGRRAEDGIGDAGTSGFVWSGTGSASRWWSRC